MVQIVITIILICLILSLIGAVIDFINEYLKSILVIVLIVVFFVLNRTLFVRILVLVTAFYLLGTLCHISIDKYRKYMYNKAKNEINIFLNGMVTNKNYFPINDIRRYIPKAGEYITIFKNVDKKFDSYCYEKYSGLVNEEFKAVVENLGAVSALEMTDNLLAEPIGKFFGGMTRDQIQYYLIECFKNSKLIELIPIQKDDGKDVLFINSFGGNNLIKVEMEL